MKDGLSSFDLLAVVRELQGLVGGFVDKVYQEGDELMFKVNVPASGRREVYCKVGKWLCLRAVPEKPETPPLFAMTLRRHLDNARIAAIEQRGFDRVVTVAFDRGPRLVFERFGKGNVVLVQDDAPVAPFRRAAFRDRQIAPRAPYDYPPAAANPLAMAPEAFAASLVAAKGSLVKALASGMNLGGQWAEEVCACAGMEKTAKIADAADERLGRVHATILDLARRIREQPEPQVVLEGGVPVDVTPIPLRQHEGKEHRPFPTFSEALAFFLERVSAETVAVDDATAKVRRKIEQQEAMLRDLRTEVVQAEALAQFVYAHFPAFDELIRRAQEGTLAVGGQVAAIDHEHHVVRVKVGDAAEIDLDWTRDVQGNAQLLYERKKGARAKAEKVVAALEASKAELARAAKKAAKVAAKPRVKATKQFWFEAYRWFLSSEGFLVIGGRDAKTNDAVVKKHLKDGDRYVHADLHGAPSCVVKEGSKAGTATLEEACAFALAWSKAWSAGLASGSAFWVRPEQVSKQAESGEYVSRGAWVIRGKRNYVHDIPVRAAVGEIEHEGHRKVMAGPVAAVAKRSSRYLIVEPGPDSKDSVARAAAVAFSVPVEEVARVLTPGGTRVVDRRL